MARKQFDWVGISLSNPGFSNTDFKDNGINIENTSIAPEEVYTSNPQIRSDALFQTNGRFDPSKFHERYIQLVDSYNNLAKDTFDDDIKHMGRIFSENNIFVSPEERRIGSNTYMTLIDNPDHISYGIVGIDLAGPRTKTPMELAESLPIYDSKTGKFTEETPESSFFKNFWRPMMLASYDEDVDINGNPTDDPTKIAHYKGEHKLNEDGEYYLEFVNGKSTYGKELLSKWNILTKEDSMFNKYDPFDSDDIEKSTTGSVVRNALKILPLLTPVAPYYVAASLGINLVDTLGTLGKLVLGSNNSTLNNITAFAESFNQTTSEKAAELTFGAENVINMVGDTYMFLKSYRILAEYAPRLFTRELPPRTVEEQGDAINKLAEAYKVEYEAAIREKYANLPLSVDPAKAALELDAEINTILSNALSIALALVNALMANYNKIGRQLSTSLMAVTFGMHTYGEAKAQGVSDQAATALTLGAVAGQYLLLSSHIGQKIFPEASVQKQQVKKALQELLKRPNAKEDLAKETANLAKEMTKEGKVKGTLTWMQKGRQLADKIWGVNSSAIGTIAANTVATGIEMSAFTALDDVIASIYNLGAWISGEENRMSAWENIAGRYGSALLGGAIAGAISAPDVYQATLQIQNMQSPLALEIIAHMINEGKAEEIKKVIRNNAWGNPYLSARKIAEREFSSGDVKEMYGTATPTDNQDMEAKLVMLETIDGMEKILTEYGAKIDSNSLLNILVNGKNITHDLRYAMLRNSNIAQMYLKEFVQNQVDIYTYAKQLSHDPKDKQKQNRTDGEERATLLEAKDYKEIPANLQSTLPKSEQLKLLDNVKEKLKAALEKNAKFLNGEMGANFISEAIFEMQPGINMPFWDGAFRQFVETETGKKYEDVSLTEKREKAKIFYETNTGEAGVTYLRMAHNKFLETLEATKNPLKTFSENTEKLKDLTSLAEDVKTFMRRALFWDGKSPNISPYSMNSLYRPEENFNRRFVSGAENKIWEDNQTVIQALRKRYKGLDSQIEEVINTLENLRRAVVGYKKFLAETQLMVKNSITKHSDWKVRKKEAEDNNKEFNEEEPVELVFNADLIQKELAKARGVRQALGNAENSFEEIISKLIEQTKAALDVEQRAIDLAPDLTTVDTTVRDQLRGLYLALTEPEAMYDESYNYVTRNGLKVIPDMHRILESTIEGLLLRTVGTRFIDELEEAFADKAGFLDTETKNIFMNVLLVFSATATKNGNLSDLFKTVITPKTDIKNVSRFNLFEALSLVDSKYSNIGALVEKVANEAADTTSEFNAIKDLLYSTSRHLQRYSPGVILTAADALMKKQGYSEHSITEILNILDAQIESQTEELRGILSAGKTNVKEFILSSALLKDINDAILVLQELRSGFVAADGEVRDSTNSIGYNPTTNKIFKRSAEDALPVLTSTLVVDLVQLIQDIIYKLMYWKEVAANAMKMRTELTDLADLGLRINLFDQISNKVASLRDQGWQKVDEFETAIGGLATLNELKGQKRQDRITNLPDEVKEAVQKEYINFESALYDFLLANDTFVKDPKKLMTFINDEKFNIEGAYNFSSINVEDKLNDDVALIWYIASIGALDPKVYYSNLKKSYTRKNLPVAIQNIWRLLAAAFVFNQEYINHFADAIVECYRSKYPDINSTDVLKKAEAQLKFLQDFLMTNINPLRRHILLVESGAGAGKTYGYLPELVRLLFLIDPALDINKDIWIAGPEDVLGREKLEDAPGSRKDMPAVAIREAIGGKENKTFTRDTLMRTILADFDEYEARYKVTDNKIEITDGSIPEPDINTGKFNFLYKLNNGFTELPKIIILDEISDYSAIDLDVLEDFATKHNIKILASGDFTQSGIVGSILIKVGNNTYSNKLKGLSCEFIRTLKSLMSFRTTNTLSDANNDAIRVYFEKYLRYAETLGRSRDETMPAALSLSHSLDLESGNLYGTYVHTDSSGVVDETLRKYIDNIYKSLENDPNKTVTLLYTDDTSPIYNYINNHSGTFDWKSRTYFRKGTVLKGVESTYYIIDLDPKVEDSHDLNLQTQEEKQKAWEERERVARELYTALTRLKQGAIVIPRFLNKLPHFDIYSKASEEDTREISMSQEFIEKRVLDEATRLDTMFPEVIKLDKRIPDPVIQPLAGPVRPGPEAAPGTEGLGEDKNYKVEPGEEFLYEELLKDDEYSKLQQLREGVKNSPMAIKPANGSTITYVSPTANARNPEITIPDEGLISLLHTFNAFRTGFVREDGKLKLKLSDRRDSAHGLYYCLSLGRSLPDLPNIDPNDITEAQEEAVKVLLTRLATIAKTETNDTILREFKEALGYAGDNNVYMRWVFTSQIGKETGGWDRDPLLTTDMEHEKGFGGKGKGVRNNQISRKELCLVIGRDDGQNKDVLLMLPIATLPHYRTLIRTSEALRNGPIGQALERLCGDAYSKSLADPDNYGNYFHEVDVEMAHVLRSYMTGANAIEGAAAIYKILDIWLATTEWVTYLDEDFLLAKINNIGQLTDMGPFLLTAARGYDYDVPGFEQDLIDVDRNFTYKVKDLEKLREDMDVSRVYTAQGSENFRYTPTSGFTIRSGAYYVLVAPKGVFSDTYGVREDEMFAYFLKQLSNPGKVPIKVKLLNVRPPKVDVDTFFESEYILLFQSPDPQTRPRQDIGNLFTAYRVLQRIMELYKPGESNWLTDILNSNISLRQSEHVNFEDVRMNVLRLTYLEGLKDVEKLEKLGEIYKIAERDLDADEKRAIADVLANNTEDLDFVGLANNFMRQNSGYKYNIRNSFRYLLWYMWDPERIGRATINGDRRSKEFIRGVLADYSLLHNPLYKGANSGEPNFLILARYENSDQETLYTFYRTETDDLMHRNNEEMYEYKGAKFLYAAELIHGPLWGDITPIINRILESFMKNNNSGDNVMVSTKEFVYYFKDKRDIKGRRGTGTPVYFDPSTKSDIDEVLRTKGILGLKEAGYYYFATGPSNARENVIISKENLSTRSGFNVNDIKIIRLDSTLANTLITNANRLDKVKNTLFSTTDGTNTKYFLLSKEEGEYKLREIKPIDPEERPHIDPQPITDGGVQNPWDQSYVISTSSHRGYDLIVGHSNIGAVHVQRVLTPSLKREEITLSTLPTNIGILITKIDNREPTIKFITPTPSEEANLTTEAKIDILSRYVEYLQNLDPVNKDIETIIPKKLSELTEVLRNEVRTDLLLVFNLDELLGQEADGLIELTSSLGMTNTRFNAKDVIDSIKTNPAFSGISPGEVISDIIDGEFSRLPAKFIEDVNKLLAEGDKINLDSENNNDFC